MHDLASLSTPTDRLGARLAPRLFAGLLALGLATGLATGLAPGDAAARGAPETFADLAEQLLPAVVNISSTSAPRGGQAQQFEAPQAQPGTPLDEFFRNFLERNRPQQQQQRPQTSLGSGFVIDAAGYVVTNNHVISEATEITVILQDDKRFPAKLVGVDTKTDLALLKIQPDRPLKALVWGDSDKARVGDWVMAIGNPFGLGGTVTAGIISARARDINQGPYDNFIQTDASINRGNSGGPLFNMDGQVIGINTAIFSPTGSSVGIGFAVPSTIARNIIAQLQQYGRTRRGWLGVRIQTVTDELAQSAGLDKARGALIASVNEGGPAELGKIVAGDIVVTFNGQPIANMRDLPRVVADTEVGRAVPVEVVREGKVTKLTVTVGELEEAEQQLAAANPAEIPPGAPSGTLKDLGMGLAQMSDELKRKFGLANDLKGVVVTEIANGGAAAEKGIQAGDVIMEVAQQDVATPADVQAKIKAAKDAGRRSVLLLVNHRGELRFIALRVSEG